MTQPPLFEVRLDVFTGPFDLLLGLISKRKLDVTQVALGEVTDEFIEYVQAMGSNWDLDQTSSFLVVAATLLDLKAARLLPSGDVEDPEDLAVLEARDLLFARLLQYRAFKEISGWIREAMASEERVIARPGGLEEQFRGLLPAVEIPGGLDGIVRAAVAAFTPVDEPAMPLEQLHLPQISVSDEARIVAARLKERRETTFRDLVSGASRLVTVARFLALLQMFRASQVAFTQLVPLGELTIRWTGGDSDVEVTDEFEGESS